MATTSKDIYAADIYAASIYAAGVWRGVGSGFVQYLVFGSSYWVLDVARTDWEMPPVTDWILLPDTKWVM